MAGTVRRRVSWLAAQAGHVRREIRDVGWVATAGERVGAMAAKSPLWRDRDATLTAMSAELVRLNARLDELATRADRAEARVATTEGALRGQASSLESTQDAIAACAANADQALSQLQHAVQEQLDRLHDGAATLQHLVTDWLWSANAPLRDHPLITVVMPTAYPERLGYLQSAMQSVLTQSYQHWELLVLDDSTDGYLRPLPSWWPNDPRIRLLRGEGNSEGRVRNQALAVARGEIVAYLDDDCRWFPWWLHAVARTFTEHADVAVVHGVRVIEAEPGGSNWTYAQVLDPLSLHVGNPADTNVTAHRRDLPDTEWPELSSCADYDTVVRLVEHGSRFIPVPAATYAVSSPSRAWAPERATVNSENFRIVQRRAKARRPLRIVAHNALYPLLSETYIGDELEALRRHGVEVVLSRDAASPVVCASRLDAPLFESMHDAVSAHDPDLVLMHWADVGLSHREHAARAGVPYAVRMHSFDGPRPVRELIDPWCAGVWTFPHFDRSHHLAFPLDTLVLDPARFHDGDRNRTVMSLSACLPKKDFTTLMAAMEHLPGVALDVVMATTNGHEALTDQVRARAEEGVGDVRVRVDVDHASAWRDLSNAGALVYSLAPGHPIGQPRSVLEAALAGTPLVLPNDPAMHDLVGGVAHFYERGSAASLAGAISASFSQPHPTEERRELAQRVHRRHANPAVHEAWAHAVTHAVVDWQRNARTDRIGRNLRWWWPN